VNLETAGRRKPPSIRDVARVAEVSYQTVSRVLNNHPSIRPDTRQRVLDAMTQLDFRPNRAARRLATKRSFTIGVVVTVNGSYCGPSSSISAIEDAAREAGYSTLLASPRRMDAAALSEALEHLIGEGVEGIVVLAPQTRTAEVIATVGKPVPVVLMQSDQPSTSPGLSVDNELGGALAARHLLGLGHRRLAMVAGPGDWSEAVARRRGFEGALAEAGVSTVAVAEGDWSAESGYDAFQRLVRHDFTGIFCANDQMALGLIHAASDRNLAVPTDLSVVGFDDVPESAHYLPPLTTIRQDFEVLGRRSIQSLLAQVEGTSVSFDVPVRPSLIVRASTLAVRSP
jgi:DNA-binding LacI/PurR family transcriptional regulator